MQTSFLTEAHSYLKLLQEGFTDEALETVQQLASDLLEVWTSGNQVLICGNGGSAANALHIANDFHYGIGACGNGPFIPGLKVEALPSNPAIITCLANDTGFENIFKLQLQVKGQKNDVLIALTGSGNSENIVRAIKYSRELGMRNYVITAFDGGRCKKIADNAIHIPINDMQIAEDSQLLIAHICMQWLNKNKPSTIKPLK
ncbi:SIS domain-containing protein [Synechococcus sp. KORDI-100]|uniref:SIS domain-containing protein n=1 Tax=Synechococcus sp. KORDI-100 TaxID=1280380 RepID=UPI00056E6EC5|nr:SIS domain-containing protein [Synechococcus sp. KORDI-100]